MFIAMLLSSPLSAPGLFYIDINPGMISLLCAVNGLKELKFVRPGIWNLMVTERVTKGILLPFKMVIIAR